MTHHFLTQSTILSAYPGLLPGFFTLADAGWCPLPSHRPKLPPYDPADPDGAPVRGWARRQRAALMERYRAECAAAISVILGFGDAILAGDSVIVTIALSAEQFDRLAALGAELEDLENDDPAEDDHTAEPALGWTEADESGPGQTGEGHFICEDLEGEGDVA